MSHGLADPVAATERGLEQLERELTAIRFEMRAAERHLSGRWSDLPQQRRDSARNLLHYLALRSRDLRALQQALASHGLSSLGRAEAHAIGTVTAVLAIVRRLRGEDPDGDTAMVSALPAAAQRDLLEINAAELLGRPPSGRDVRIMVTITWQDRRSGPVPFSPRCRSFAGSRRVIASTVCPRPRGSG